MGIKGNKGNPKTSFQEQFCRRQKTKKIVSKAISLFRKQEALEGECCRK